MLLDATEALVKKGDSASAELMLHTMSELDTSNGKIADLQAEVTRLQAENTARQAAEAKLRDESRAAASTMLAWARSTDPSPAMQKVVQEGMDMLKEKDIDPRVFAKLDTMIKQAAATSDVEMKSAVNDAVARKIESQVTARIAQSTGVMDDDQQHLFAMIKRRRDAAAASAAAATPNSSQLVEAGRETYERSNVGQAKRASVGYNVPLPEELAKRPMGVFEAACLRHELSHLPPDIPLDSIHINPVTHQSHALTDNPVVQRGLKARASVSGLLLFGRLPDAPVSTLIACSAITNSAKTDNGTRALFDAVNKAMDNPSAIAMDIHRSRSSRVAFRPNGTNAAVYNDLAKLGVELME